MVRVLGLALACSVAVLSAPAAAQEREPTEAELQEARALFVAGEAAIESGRWADAVERFSRAYELSDVPVALYNVAYALRSLGRHRESRDTFRRLLADHPELDPDLRAASERYLREEEARVATLTVSDLDAEVRYGVRLDSREIEDDGERPLRIDTDPGPHTLTIRHPTIEPFIWEGSLEDGQRLTIRADLVPIAGVADETEHRGDPPAGDRGVLSSPWFWLAVGVVVLGAGAGVGYLLYQDAQLDPNSRRVYEL